MASPGDGDTAFCRAIWALLMVKVLQFPFQPSSLHILFFFIITIFRQLTAYTASLPSGTDADAFINKVAYQRFMCNLTGSVLCHLQYELDRVWWLCVYTFTTQRYNWLPVLYTTVDVVRPKTTWNENTDGRPGPFRSLKLALMTATCIYLLVAF